jgi:hypothetical protein
VGEERAIEMSAKQTARIEHKPAKHDLGEQILEELRAVIARHTAKPGRWPEIYGAVACLAADVVLADASEDLSLESVQWHLVLMHRILDRELRHLLAEREVEGKRLQ